MKFLPGIGVSKLSGTIGGVTAQSWRGLGVFRRKPIPTKTLTPRQIFINALMTSLSQAWRDVLTQGLRTAWNQRAKNFPWVDVFGNERKMTGENLYIKQNMVLLDHGLARQDTPVPETIPPELTDLTVTVEPSQLVVNVPQLDSAIITAQTPFLDIFVAGGFLDVTVNIPEVFVEVDINTLALPQGRVDQKSDFRHAAYADDKEEGLPPEVGTISVRPPALQTRNVTIVVRRYNKFGNFTAPVKFSIIVTGA